MKLMIDGKEHVTWPARKVRALHPWILQWFVPRGKFVLKDGEEYFALPADDEATEREVDAWLAYRVERWKEAAARDELAKRSLVHWPISRFVAWCARACLREHGIKDLRGSVQALRERCMRHGLILPDHGPVGA